MPTAFDRNGNMEMETSEVNGLMSSVTNLEQIPQSRHPEASARRLVTLRIATRRIAYNSKARNDILGRRYGSVCIVHKKPQTSCIMLSEPS